MRKLRILALATSLAGVAAGCKTNSGHKGGAKPKAKPVVAAPKTPMSQIEEANARYAGDQGPAFEQLATEAKGVSDEFQRKMADEGLVSATEEEQAFDASMEALSNQSTEELAAGLAAPGLDEITPQAEEAFLEAPGLQESIATGTAATGVKPKGGGGGSGSNTAWVAMGAVVAFAGLVGAYFCGRAWASHETGSQVRKRAGWATIGFGVLAVAGAAFALWQGGAFGLTTDPTALRKARYRQMALLELSRIKLRRDALVADLDARGLRDAGLSLNACKKSGAPTDQTKSRVSVSGKSPKAQSIVAGKTYTDEVLDSAGWNKAHKLEDIEDFQGVQPYRVSEDLSKVAIRTKDGKWMVQDVELPQGVTLNFKGKHLDTDGELTFTSTKHAEYFINGQTGKFAR